VTVTLQIEKWSFVDALYWALVTITTVGFGDVVPQTHSGKAFTVVFCLVGCTILAWSVNSLIRYPLVIKAKQSELKVMMQFGGKLSEETLRSMLASDFFDRNPNLRQDEHSVTKSEFILLLLSMMNKINDKDVLIISKIFDMLDDQKQSKTLPPSAASHSFTVTPQMSCRLRIFYPKFAEHRSERRACGQRRRYDNGNFRQLQRMPRGSCT
jgi:hypothetical protein